MNERIKQLAEQAGGHNNISKFRGHYLPLPNGYIDPSTVDLEKFAELLVKECAEFARQHNLQKADRSHMIHQAMKEHFGVGK